MASSELLQKIRLNGGIPRHVAIIMDGNGRWAAKQGMRRIHGHRSGTESVREISTVCARMGVKSLTLYSFSVENWKRPRHEVRYLMRLLRSYLIDERPTLMKNDVRFMGIGRLSDLPDDARRELTRTEELTRDNEGMLLRLALSYGSRTEMADAVRAVCEDVRAGRLDPEQIDDETLRAYLYDPLTPDPDLLIRTAGEMRISNFLLWQLAYAEIVVSPVLWPDFNREHFFEAIIEYQRRERRFGRVTL